MDGGIYFFHRLYERTRNNKSNETDVLPITTFIVGDGARRMKGAWDSIHVFEAQEKGRNAHYKLTSTVMLYMVTNKPDLGNLNLSGSMTRQVKRFFFLQGCSKGAAV